jgi:general secretion pathway protein G
MERIERRRGFTLIEIMAVVLIIGLLTTLVGTYRMDNARFPTTEQGLHALIEAPPDVRNFQTGGYLREKRIPVDPWGNPYQYESPGTHNDHSFDLWSWGADGAAGG